MSTHPAERWEMVKAGHQPVHFRFDGFTLSCYFSRSAGELLDTVPKSRAGDGDFIYARFYGNADRVDNTLHFALQNRVPNGLLPSLDIPYNSSSFHGVRVVFCKLT